MMFCFLLDFFLSPHFVVHLIILKSKLQMSKLIISYCKIFSKLWSCEDKHRNDGRLAYQGGVLLTMEHQ